MRPSKAFEGLEGPSKGFTRRELVTSWTLLLLQPLSPLDNKQAAGEKAEVAEEEEEQEETKEEAKEAFKSL